MTVVALGSVLLPLAGDAASGAPKERVPPGPMAPRDSGEPGPVGERPTPAAGSDLARLGGFERLEGIIADFVGRVRGDPMIGFLFVGVDFARLWAMEVAFAASHLDATIPWRGRPLRAIHAPHPIGRGHFDRRRELLRQTLAAHAVEPELAGRWIAHVDGLRDLIVPPRVVGPGDAPSACPEPAGPPIPTPLPEPGPIDRAVLADAWDKLARAFRRVEARAPEAVRARVEAVREALAGLDADSPVATRLAIARQLEDLSLELRGQVPFDPQFYRDGRLAIVRVMETVRIRGAIDHARIDAAFERYLRRAEAAWARMVYFFKRAGVDLTEAEAKPVPPWEQPYARLEESRELLWGRTAPPTKAPPPRRG